MALRFDLERLFALASPPFLAPRFPKSYGRLILALVPWGDDFGTCRSPSQKRSSTERLIPHRVRRHSPREEIPDALEEILGLVVVVAKHVTANVGPFARLTVHAALKNLLAVQ